MKDTTLLRLHRRRNPFLPSALLTGSLGLALLPLVANAQINRSRPPTPPPSSGSSSGGSSSKSSGSSSNQSSNSGNSGGSQSGGSQSQSSGNRTPPARNSGGGNSGGGSSSSRNNPSFGGSGSTSSGGGNSSLRYNPTTQRGSNPFSNPVHQYTGPLSPFDQYRPPTSGSGNRTPNIRGPHSGPLSPFMTYQPPNNTRRNYPSGFDRFNQKQESFFYRYRNGVFGRNNTCYYQGWGESFFPGGVAFFPYYYPTFVRGTTILSPYAYHVDLFPSFISVNVGTYAPPSYVYVPVPVYQNGIYSGWRQDDIDDYYLNREAARLRDKENQLRDKEEELNAREREMRDREGRAWRQNRDLTIAVDDISRAWMDKDIQMLAKHTRRDVAIAVYLRGKYQYSLDAADYLDMTRDAFRAARTLKFKLDKVERKEADIYLVTGRHTYRDKEGEERSVLVSYVLEKMNEDYIITQVGTAPERLEAPEAPTSLEQDRDR